MSPAATTIDYQMSRATREQILEHLQCCSAQFVPPLAARVELAEYAEKLQQHSLTFEAWQGDWLIGLVAAYVALDERPEAGFVSSVSVLESFRSRGIGRRLLVNCHRECQRRGIQSVSLQVSNANQLAIRFYEKLGYTRAEAEGDDDIIRMQLELEP